MSTDWTAERLDALPDHTVILTGGEPLRRDYERAGEMGWMDPEGRIVFTTEILAEAAQASIRVVSVPIDALLADDTIAELANYLAGQIEGLVLYTEARIALRAALSHVTGDAQ